MPQILIGMTQHNHQEYTKQAVASLPRTANPYLVFVQDDASEETLTLDQPGGCEGLAIGHQGPPAVGLIESWNRILHFWLKSTTADFCVFTNNDVVFMENWDAQMVEAFANNESCGMSGPMTNHPGHQPLQGTRAVGSLAEFAFIAGEAFGTARPDPASEGVLVGGGEVASDPFVVPFLNGFCFMLERGRLVSDGFESLYGPGEKHLGSEDWYTRLMRSKGQMPFLCPESFVFHYRSVTIGARAFDPGRPLLQMEQEEVS